MLSEIQEIQFRIAEAEYLKEPGKLNVPEQDEDDLADMRDDLKWQDA